MKLAYVAAFACGLALAGTPQKSGKQEVSLQKAIQTEMVDGDLKSAIEMYGKIAQSGDRALAAKALVRMGQCYEKLGDTEARKAYERVVREFSDQRESAVSARERLAALARASKPTAPGGVTQRFVWSTNARDWGGVSADGRWVAFQGDQGDLAIHDLVTGQDRLLTDYGPWGERPGFAVGGVFSPDGKRVAYAWWVYETHTYEVRVVNLDGAGERTLYRNDNITEAFPRAWTPDGAAVLVALYVASGERQILLISLSDGSVRLLRAEKGPHLYGPMAMSPDGRFLGFTSLGSIYALDLQFPERGRNPVTLVESASDNWLMGWSPDGRYILFVSDRTGARDAWLLPVEEGKPAGSPRLVKSGLASAPYVSLDYVANEIVPMGLTRMGTFFYGIQRTDTDAMTLMPDSSSGRLDGAPVRFIEGFDGSTLDLQWSPDGNRAFCQRGDTLLLRDLDSRWWREIHPRSGLQKARWHPDGKSVIGVGRKSGSFGVYQVDLDTGAMAPLALDHPERSAKESMEFLASYGGGPLNMTQSAVLSSDGKTLYRAVGVRQGHRWVGGRVVARILNSREEKVIHRTRQDEAFVSDIALSPDGTQMASLNLPWAGPARIYVFPVSGDRPENPPLCASQVDSRFWAITWLRDGKSLLATVNRSITAGELWRIPLDGGQPQKWPLPFLARGLHVHPDGRRIGITAWHRVNEVWALENFLPRETTGR